MAKGTPTLDSIVEEFLGRADYRPLRQHELARALKLSAPRRRELRNTLRWLESEGRVIRLRKNRWALPRAAKQMTGVLRVHVRGFGFVELEERGAADVYIPDDALGTALDGDRVLISVVQLPARRRKQTGKGLPAAPPEDRLEGRIERVLERGHPRVVGLLCKTPYYDYVVPDNPRILQDVRLVRPPGEEQARPPAGHKVVVELEPWRSPDAPLTGTMVEDLGPADAPSTAARAVLREYELDEAFPAEVEAAAKAVPRALPDSALDGRRDLRSLLTFTIDPPDARDFDDAVSLERLPDGQWSLGIHIADVPHFVADGSAVDQEARSRGTSVYLVDRVITMLPPVLTTDVCSLRPGGDRLTHTVQAVLTPEGEVTGFETFRSVIRSAARLDYETVQAFFDDPASAPEAFPDAIGERLQAMRVLSQRLRRERARAGALEFAMPEVRCELDEEGRVVGLHQRRAQEAYQLIEEFMLVANRCVALRIAESKIPGLYRVHEPPDDAQWASMAEALQGLGLMTAPSTPHELLRLVDSVSDPTMRYMTELSILRNLKRALYSEHLGEHFGLAFSHYTHFTSPIRRYPDLLVHRILNTIEKRERGPYSASELGALAVHCSIMERKADDAEKDSVSIATLAYFERQLWDGETGPHTGVVVGMTPKGLLVELRATLQKGMVPFRSFPNTSYRVNRSRTRAVERRTRQRWEIGDQVQVELTRVDTARRQVDFRMASREPAADTAGKQRRHRKR